MSCQPASSVHLNYTLPAFDKNLTQKIRFSNATEVLQSASCTYVSVIQFWPGGYCGIQERAPGHEKNAIFSLWHDDESGHNVELIQKGPGTTVEPFGGEGTGLKCTLPFDWKVNEKIQFTVTTEQTDGAWDVSCNFTYRGQYYNMATYRRSGANPMQTMTCFIEDYGRHSGAMGLMHCRSARFFGAQCTIDGKIHALQKASFSRSESPADCIGHDRCSASANQDSFILTTGGATSLPVCCQPGTILTCDK